MTKILVVDYQEPDLEILIQQSFRKKILSNELEFLFAHNLEDAISLFTKDSAIDIILTDIKIELLKEISKTKRSCKTIVLTPHGDIESIRTAMNQGAFDFVTRPIHLKELELTIMKTIDQLEKNRAMEKVQKSLFDIESELEVAKSIQTSILPHNFTPLTHHHNFEIYGSMLPAKRVGGDFFDFFPIDDHHLAFTIADVSGKGIPAALFMSMTRGLLRALGKKKTKSPLTALQQLNDLISFENESSMFVTAFYGILDARTGVIEYCNAGHNPPYLIRANGELEQIGRSEGIALGMIQEPSHFKQNTLTLNKNDALLLYTDGVTEAMDQKQQLFEETRLEDILKQNHNLPLRSLLESILKKVEAFSRGEEQSDDITLLALRML